MAKFIIKTLAPDGTQPTFIYDNATSSLTTEDGRPVLRVMPKAFGDAEVISVDQPGRKGIIRTLKVSLGLSCNYECNYCSQRFVPHAESSNPGEIEPFLAQLTNALTYPPQRIEFWGGEPMVYWKTLKPLAERMRDLYPKAGFAIITNGSLLDEEKNSWLDDLGFDVGISHDGPGYHARGADPMDDPEKRAAIMDLYARLKPKGRISINCMMHKENPSRAAVQDWLRARFGDDVIIGEGAFIDPYDEGGMAATLETQSEQIGYRVTAFDELRTGRIANFSITNQKIQGFINSLREARPASSVGQKCGMDKADSIAVDLYGNVLTCQNVSAASTSPNGESHLIGKLDNLEGVAMKTATHWSKREECSSCPVLQLCQGSCMFLHGPLWDAGCDASYSDNIPFFAAGLEYLTGCKPVYIEGEFRKSRKDIFGLVHGIPKEPVKRVIPILPL
jgi:uncharacterized protein